MGFVGDECAEQTSQFHTRASERLAKVRECYRQAVRRHERREKGLKCSPIETSSDHQRAGISAHTLHSWMGRVGLQA